MFPVRLPSGVRYWTVLDEGLSVVGEADAFLRHGVSPATVMGPV